MGLLGILSAIATVSYNSYLNRAEKQAIRTALNKLDSSFNACMSYSNFDGSKCDTLKKVGYIKSNKHRVTIKPDPPKANQKDLCLLVRKAGNAQKYVDYKEGLRGCIQYKNGQMIRKCFEKTSAEGKAGCSKDGVCCAGCPQTITVNDNERNRCEVG